MNDIGKEGVKEHPLSGGWYKRTSSTVQWQGSRRPPRTSSKKVAQSPLASQRLDDMEGLTKKVLRGDRYSRQLLNA